ncbi:MAG: hypothetical protein HW378_3703, partial [Anaerolineales bacterium]|nr:hypothetical protein [Anaerolineales bacterium]
MPLTAAEWDDFVRANPHGHILQTSAWGQLKSAFGWRAESVRVGDHGALVLFRPLPLGWSLAYVPRGPLANWNYPETLGGLVAALDHACRARRAICLKWEPDLPDSPACAAALTSLGFRPSPQVVQPRRTLVVDLSGGEADLLARMKQKTRYNIGLAAKKEVTVRAAQSAADEEAFVGLMRVTGERDRFGVHTEDYYRRAYDLFHPAGLCELFLAEYRGEPLAGVMAFALGRRAWYFYGASSDRERSRTYDLWGVPDENEEALEAGFETRRDGLWGVYRFKRGFGGKLVRTVGAWDRVYNP